MGADNQHYFTVRNAARYARGLSPKCDAASSLRKGAITARFIRVEDTKACLMTFWPDQKTAMAAKDAQRAIRDEIRKNHKIVSMEGMTSFVLER